MSWVCRPPNVAELGMKTRAQFFPCLLRCDVEKHSTLLEEQAVASRRVGCSLAPHRFHPYPPTTAFCRRPYDAGVVGCIRAPHPTPRGKLRFRNRGSYPPRTLVHSSPLKNRTNTTGATQPLQIIYCAGLCSPDSSTGRPVNPPKNSLYDQQLAKTV